MATAVLTEGSDRRAVLAAFERALARELPSLAAVDLGPLPTFVWQQLHNRLQWDGAAPQASLAAQRERRSKPHAAPWLRLHSGDDVAATTVSAFSADGSHLIAGDAGGGVTLHDTAARGATARWQAHAAPVTACAFSSRGDLILTAAENGELRLWDAVTRTLRWAAEGHETGVTACAFSPDGARIASGDKSGLVAIRRTAASAPPAICSEHVDCYRPAVTALAFSPDGVLLASAANNRSGSILVRHSTTGDILATLTGSPPRTTALAISSDGRFLVSGSSSGHVRLWGLRTAVELATLRGRNTGAPAVARCAFSRDERFIVCTDRFGHVTAWDKATARAVAATVARPAPYDLSSDRATRFELSLAGGAWPIAVWLTAAEPQCAEMGPADTTIAALDWSGSLSVLRICGGPASGSS
jgi:WD40 repeat protein